MEEAMSERIQLTDSTMDVVMKMSEGNPGAVTVIMSLFKDAAKIDPDNWMPGLGEVLSLDTLGIYGSKIWMFYKDVCSEDLVKMCAVIRSHQLGITSKDSFIHAIDNRGDGLDVDDLLNQVKTRLPAFGNI
jgi:hypothetical protein